MDVRPNTSNSTHDDDGFESLNGNGSSDNPEEDILTGSVTSQMSETTSAEQSSSTPKHNQFVKKSESNVTFIVKKTVDDLGSKNIPSQKRCLKFKKTPISSKASIADLDRRLSGKIYFLYLILFG